MQKSVENVHKNLAGGSYEAEAPFSLTTALYPMSSLTLFPESTTHPFVFWEMLRKFKMFEMAEVYGMRNGQMFRPSKRVLNCFCHVFDVEVRNQQVFGDCVLGIPTAHRICHGL